MPVSSSTIRSVDEDFLALPLHATAEAALQAALDLGADHVDVRIERLRSQSLRLRDARLETQFDADPLGIAVRVVHQGTWGFAAGTDLTIDEAVRLAQDAVDVARTSRPLSTVRVELAPEPAHQGSWVSPYDVDPFSIDVPTKVARIGDLAARLLASEHVQHADAGLTQVKEQKFYLDHNGTDTMQQRVRLQCQISAVNVHPDRGFETMRTLAPPVGRGWEWLQPVGSDAAGSSSPWDWDREIEQLPELLHQKATAPTVEAGTYDVVVDPSNLWLTIHESIGHATELDRALGYEAAYAGTSFATLDKLGTLQYGSPSMHVTGDRTTEHGLASIGWDDDGVETQQWDIVRDGVLVGYQTDRAMAAQNRDALGTTRSNGCALADSPFHMPIQRMANVSLRPAPDGPSTDELIAGVERGVYIVGDNSWSIDMQRYNFQFTGQRFFKIENGRLAGQVRDVAYQATTTDFWRSMDAVGGPQTYVLGGALNCGKGQPGQVAAVSHGCPSARFRNVRILNTTQESGR